MAAWQTHPCLHMTLGMTVPKKLLWDLAPMMLREAQNHLVGSLAVGKGWPLQGVILDVSESQVSPRPRQENSTNTDVCAPGLCQAIRKGPLVSKGLWAQQPRSYVRTFLCVFKADTQKDRSLNALSFTLCPAPQIWEFVVLNTQPLCRLC